MLGDTFDSRCLSEGKEVSGALGDAQSSILHTSPSLTDNVKAPGQNVAT